MYPDEYTPATYRAACQTAGCDNAGISLVIEADARTPFVVCGPCGYQITELVLVAAD